jgi:hypothetical protein
VRTALAADAGGRYIGLAVPEVPVTSGPGRLRSLQHNQSRLGASVSVDLVVYLPRASMPNPERWAQAIRDSGFAVELGTAFDPDTATGFHPCRFRGVESGFEYYASRLSEEERRELGAPPGCDFSVNLVTHSDLRECATSLIAASVLCQISGGLLVDPQSGERFAAPVVLAWAREQLDSFQGRIK